MNTSIESIIPENKKGKPSDIEHSVTSVNREQANDTFRNAREKMLNINEWHRIGSFLSAELVLTDFNGRKLKRPAGLHDFIRIDVQGPGSSAGDGYDWVNKEVLEDNSHDLPTTGITGHVIKLLLSLTFPYFISLFFLLLSFVNCL